MAGINITREDLQFLTGTSIADGRFDVIDKIARRLITRVYKADINAAAGRHEDVINSVFTSVAVRLLTNPTGVSNMAAGAASLSFGGASEPLVLTPDEADMLRSLTASRPSYVTFLGYDPTVPVLVEGIDEGLFPEDIDYDYGLNNYLGGINGSVLDGRYP